MLPSAKRQRTDKGPASISPSTYRPDFNPDDAKTPGFFSDVLKEFGVETANPNIAIITVNHVVSTLPHYLGALENIGRIAGVIQKSSYEDPRVKEYVNAQGYFFLDWTKEQILENPKGFVEYLKTIIKEEEKLVIVDIGGYFAPCVEAFANDPWCREHIIGIVEDTQNGHDKYKKVVDKSHVPIISVAQSELKKTEDYNVGKSIVEAADTILRDTAATITERMKICVVIGFGKIGRSIAEHLRKKGIQEIIVLEINDALLMEAASLGFKICRAADQDQALKKADMIFSATGKQALKDNIFAELKDKAFVASVTSSEDEMSLTWLKEHAEIIPHKNIVEYKINGKSIYLLSDGNAVNFTYGGINGPYICSVQAELLIAAHKLIKKEEYVVKPELQELSSGDMQTIAGIWLDTYETQRLNIPNEVTFQFQNENLFLIPEYSPHFIGRESLLEKIGLCYQSNNRASFKPLVLIGLGGLGKSELALKYAWNNRVQYTNCFYLSGDTLEADLEKMATELGLLQNEEKVSIEQIYDQLKLLGKTLLIFDDVESYNKIEKYLPPKKKGFSQSNFNILMTTRNQNGWSECETIVINPDDQVLKDDAVRYIQKELTYEERNTAIQLAKALQYHPLALSQAVAFIRNNPDCDISTYLRLLEEKTREMLSFPRQEPHEDQNKCMVSTTWNISLQALDLETRNIIQMSAFLFPDSIQNNLFASIINPNAYLLNLLQYSLIHRTDQYSFKIHRLLQEVIRDQLNREEKVQQLSRLIPFLSAQTAYRRIDLDPVVAAAHHLESFRAYMKKPGVNILDSEIAAQEYPRFLYQVALYYLDHLYHNEYAFEILTHARNLVGVVVSEDLTIRIQRQYAKA